MVGSVRFGEGHINDTFCVHTQPPDGACRRFILQRISAAAFGNPEQLMRNVVGVTDYLKKVIAREGGNPDRETLTHPAHPDRDVLLHRPCGRGLAVHPLY